MNDWSYKKEGGEEGKGVIRQEMRPKEEKKGNP